GLWFRDSRRSPVATPGETRDWTILLCERLAGPSHSLAPGNNFCAWGGGQAEQFGHRLQAALPAVVLGDVTAAGFRELPPQAGTGVRPTSANVAWGRRRRTSGHTSRQNQVTPSTLGR